MDDSLLAGGEGFSSRERGRRLLSVGIVLFLLVLRIVQQSLQSLLTFELLLLPLLFLLLISVDFIGTSRPLIVVEFRHRGLFVWGRLCVDGSRRLVRLFNGVELRTLTVLL
jgi:hypothetical protein